MLKKKPQKLRGTAESESDLSDDEIQEYHKQRDKILVDSDFDDTDDSKEQEVYGLGESSDSEDEDIARMEQQLRQIKRNQIKKKMGSDLEDDSEDEAVPDSRAWGHKKSWFLGGDVRDNKIILSGSEDEAGAAALEEIELRKLRERRLEQLTVEDYFPPHFMEMMQKAKEKKEKKQKKRKTSEIDDEEAGPSDKIDEEEAGPSDKKKKNKGTKKKKSSAEGGEVEKIQFQPDLSDEAEFERLLVRHPEFPALFEDFKSKMQEFQERIIPLMGLVKRGNIDGGGADFIKMKFLIITNYLICGGFYMYYVGQKTPQLHRHPVMKRLLEFQQFYNRLVPTEERVKPQLDEILELVRQGKEVNVVCTQEEDASAAAIGSKKACKARAQEGPAGTSNNAKDSLGPKFEEGDDFDETELGNQDEAEYDYDYEDGPGRRAITKEMAKNKGLRAHRNKNKKNPRIKLREKYRRALIRRKGQVRDYRPPQYPYDGEMTGIRIGIIRSRKLS